MSLGELAVHLSNLLYCGVVTVRDEGFDMKPAGQPAWTAEVRVDRRPAT